MAAPQKDVNDMFEKMGQKLGWFKHKDLNTALKALSGSTKKKPSKLRLKKTSSKTDSKTSENSTSIANIEKKGETISNSRNFENKASKPKTDFSKASSFKGFLSSDSDSSDCDDVKGEKPKLILQVASDSEEEASVYREDTYVSCIGESPVKSNRPSLAPSCYDSSHHRKSIGSYEYEETILTSRVSMATFSLDLDSIGDPLVESTRIHRRSSVTYKQIISPNSSEGSMQDGGSVETSPYLQRAQGDIGKDACENDLFCSELKNLTLQKEKCNREIDRSCEDVGSSVLVHHNETKYTTAIENLKELDDTHVVAEEDENGVNRNGAIGKEQQRQIKERDLEVIVETSSSNDSDIEVIEVVDVAIQTEEEVNTEHDTKSEDNVYCEDTVHDVPVYDQVTVCKEVNDETQTTEIISELVEYEQSTVNKGELICELHGNLTTETEPETSCNYNDATNTKSAGSQYEQETVSMEPVEKENEDEGMISCSETNGSSSLDSTASDYSVIEVRDMAIQTESPHVSHNESDNNELIEQVTDHIDSNSLKENSVGLGEVASESFESEECHVAQEEMSKSIADDNPDLSVDDSLKSDSENEEPDNKPVHEKKSSGNFSLLSSDSGDDQLDFSTIRLRAEARETEKSIHDDDTREPQKLDTTSQSWRAERKYSSESSDDEDKLEAFFQKLRKPEKEESESEQSEDDKSIDDFVVEDDDMTSESDDNAFYIRETQKMENASLAERLKKNKGLLVNQIASQGSDDDDDEVFSSKLYPDSVTKHKKQTIGKPKGTPRSWSLSSDSGGSSNDNSPQQKRGTGAQDRKYPKPGTSMNKPKGNVTKKMNFSDVSSDSESEDLPLFKTPNPIRKTKSVQNTGKENKPRRRKVGGHESGSISEDKENKGKTSKSKALTSYISLSDDDSDDDSFPSIGSISSSTDNTSSTNVSWQDENLFKLPTPISKGRQPRVVTPLSTRGSHTYSFLSSLSSLVEDESRRHPDAVRYVKNFKKLKEDLTKNLFSLYNRTVFQGKLPSDLSILWNKRLLRTAGYCAYKRHRDSKEDRTARVELSTKVCDSAERVRDTLVHELCHAAVWLLNGVNGGHGPFWKYWARQANKVHPELPVIGRCHSYSINTKFTYRCTKCGYSIGRHSKSLNTEKKVCGYCRGTFELIQNDMPTTPRSAASSSLSSAPATPRTPNRFALFVKENYNTVKQKDKALKHGDVMKELSKLFAESKIST